MTNKHPLQDLGFHIRHFKSFGPLGCDIPDFMPINIIVGRNNSGKSSIIDALEICIKNGENFGSPNYKKRGDTSPSLIIKQPIPLTTIERVFRRGTSGGGVPRGDHFTYGQKFLHSEIRVSYDVNWHGEIISELDVSDIELQNQDHYVNEIVANLDNAFLDLRIVKIASERDVVPETNSPNKEISDNGVGTTNVVQSFLNLDSLPRYVVQEYLREALNTIYNGDSYFDSIICQSSDTGEWEIFLSEKQKGDVRLSESGSSLKSIFIMLSKIFLESYLNKTDWNRVIIAIEEPENDLHPSLLRRLLEFLGQVREEKGFSLILTTHSPICIDWASKRDDSQVIHVKCTPEESYVSSAVDYKLYRDILDDLDIRASDILQSNGIIWVEGPSDRIYLRRWIDLFTSYKLIEGVHYSCMFYGGKLLSHLDALPPEDSDKLISLLSLNRNLAVIVDSDIKEEPNKLVQNLSIVNETKRRIFEEVTKIGGMAWITAGREVENYVNSAVFEKATGENIEEIGQFDSVFETKGLSKYGRRKVELASLVAGQFGLNNLIESLDLKDRVAELVQHVRRWNSISN